MPLLSKKPDVDLEAAKAFLATVDPNARGADIVSMVLAVKHAVAALIAREEKKS